jgi:hypothetical protein
MVGMKLTAAGMKTSLNIAYFLHTERKLWMDRAMDVNSLSAKSVLAGEKLVATYSISTEE